MNPHIGTTKKKRSQQRQLWGRWSKGNLKRTPDIGAMVRCLLSYQVSKPQSLAVPRAAEDAHSQVLTQAELRKLWELQRFWRLFLKIWESNYLLCLWELSMPTWKSNQRSSQQSVLTKQNPEPSSKALWRWNRQTVVHSQEKTDIHMFGGLLQNNHNLFLSSRKWASKSKVLANSVVAQPSSWCIHIVKGVSSPKYPV